MTQCLRRQTRRNPEQKRLSLQHHLQYRDPFFVEIMGGDIEKTVWSTVIWDEKTVIPSEEGIVHFGSLFQGMVHRGEGSMATAGGDWSHDICSQEAEKQTAAGAQLMPVRGIVPPTFRVNLPTPMNK